MANIDERVVAISFENTVFEQRVATTMTTLGKLDTAIKNIGNANGLQNIENAANKVTLQAPMSALDKLKAKLSGAGSGAAEGLGQIDTAGNKVSLEGPNKALDKLKGKFSDLSAGSTFTDIEKAADRTDLSGLSRALDNVGSKFGVLETAASVALGNIASQAIMKGTAVAKAFSLDPIMAGFHNYETQINAVQTILANTGLTGKQGLGQVNDALGELNTYANQTVYNFSEMAKNIGTFTAAGVDLNTATGAIKGIANLAALSGSNSQQASTAMYQLSQAISAGKVGLQDWNSVVNAGMGGSVFQRALATTAEKMGTLKKGSVDLTGPMKKVSINGQSFREAITAKPGEKSWLTSDVLTNTLKQFTGDLSDAQLAAQGFNTEEIKAIQAQAKVAVGAATNIKTFSQLTDALKEEVGSAWANVFKILFGDINQATTLFSGLHTFMENALTGPVNNFAKTLGEWAKLGGRKDLFDGIKSAFQDLEALIKPIQEAFRQIFPAATGKQLADMSKSFKDLADSLKIDPQTADSIRRTFAGIFAVFDIAKGIIEGVIGVIFSLIGATSKGAGGILAFTGGIGDFLVALDTSIAKGGLFKGIFAGLTAVLKIPLALIGALASAIANLFGGDHADAAQGLSSALGDVDQKLGPLKKVIDIIVDGWNSMVTALGKVKDALEPWFDQMADKLSGIGTIFLNAFKGLDYDKIMSGLQVGFIGGIFLTLKKALGGGLPSIFGDTFKGVNSVMEGFTKNLEAMQQNVKADTLFAIGAAIALLAGGIFVLAQIDGKSLAKSMSAVAVGLGELVGAMALLGAATKNTGNLSLVTAATGMLIMAGAVLVLSAAIKVFSTMKWEGIAKGLLGVGGSIVVIGDAMKTMGSGAKLAIQAAGLAVMGVALNIIAVAVQQFGAMKMLDIAKGVFGIVEALAGIALVMEAMPPDIAVTAAGLVILGIALSAIGGAIKSLGSLDFATLLKGLGAIMLAIAGIGYALAFVPPQIGLTALGLLVVGQAMVVTAGAIALLGKLSWGTLVKGLVGLAGALIVLAGGLTLMIVSAPGAVALMAAAAALAVLVPVIGLLGTMKWSTIFKGLGAIALVLATIGIAGLLAAPALLALGLALIPLGLGMLLVASSAKLFADALALLGTEGQKGVGIFLAALTGFIALLPNILIGMLKGLLSVVDQVVTLAPKIVVALGVIIDTVIAFIIEAAPKLAVAIGVLITAILKILVDNAPKIITAGNQLLMDLLNGISSNISKITDKVSEIVVKFLNALDSNMPRLITAGVKTLEAFLNGISSKFGELSNTVDIMISRFAQAVANHEARLVTIAGNMMLAFIGGIASYVPKLVDRGADIVLSFISGLGKDINKIVAKGADVIIAFIDGIGQNMNKIANKGADAVINFLNAMATTIRTKGPELRAAGFNVADALIDGIWQGIDQLGQKVVDKLGELVKLLPKKVRELLGITSPSKVFAEIGMNTMLGFSKGIDDNSKAVVDSSNTIGNSVIGAFRDVLGIHSPSDVMRDLGLQVGRGFAQGLEGSKDDIDSAFSSLNDKLIDNIRSAKTDIASGNKDLEGLQKQHADKLKDLAKLESAKKPDKDAIAQAKKDAADLQNQIDAENKSISANETLLSKNRDVRALLTQGMSAEKAQLEGLRASYDSITTQLEAANDALNSAIQARDQAKQSLTEKFDTTPTIDEDSKTKVTDYVAALAKQVAATKQYTDTLAKLRAAGLDDTTYQKLLDEGLAGQDFADQLFKGGKGAIDKVNDLDSQLLSASQTLAQNAADTLYQAGVNAAQGLVDGLKAQQAALQAQMTALADAMVAELKKQLGIRSPSRIFADLGRLTMDGLAKGLSDGVSGAKQVLVSTASDIVATAQDAFSKVPDLLDGLVDMNPTITPVLDLSNVQNGAKQLSDLTNVTPITAAASYGQASAASQEVSTVQQAAADAATSSSPTLNFVQNNTSPEALSDVEIYRQTKNQLGQIKSGLGLAS